MKLRKILCMLLVFVMEINCLPVPASAAEISDKGVLWLEDLEYEWVDLAAVGPCEEDVVLLDTSSINGTIPEHSIRTMGQPLSMLSGDTLTFQCSYSPSSASVDFGVITSNGRFYYINVKEGSINQAIRISQSGSYAVAIRNNSSQTVSVVGFVNY